MVRGRVHKIVFLAAALLVMAAPELALAAGEGTVRDVLSNVRSNVGSKNVQTLFGFASVMIGLMLAVQSILMFKAHVDSPANNPISRPIKYFIAAGMFLSLTVMADALRNTIFGYGNRGLGMKSSTGWQIGHPGAGAALDGMVYRFIGDFSTPMLWLTGIFSFLGGLSLLMVAIHRLTKTAQEGPRGPTGLGTMMTFLAAGALMSGTKSVAVFSNSLFGKSTASQMAVVKPNVVDAASAYQIAGMTEAILLFVSVVGYIAFVRGLFVLKAFGDGSGNATLAQALTFMIGGTLAINLGGLINVLSATLGLNAIQFY